MKQYLIALVFILALHYTPEAQHRNRVNFNAGWKFLPDSTGSYSDPSANDAAWRSLRLPHDWSIEGTFNKDNPAGTGGGALPGGIGWYRKTFNLPDSVKNKLVYIEFDGVYRNSEVFINGRSLGIRPYGYSSFQYELSPYLHFGKEKNVIAVKVDNSKQPNSRWYSGSGIYRNVWLTTVNPAHIQQWGTYITTPVINKESASVRIATRINTKDGTPLTLVTTI